MAITELYVDPSIAGDSGAGTVGDPYGDLQYCLDSEAFDTTNGTRINIKAGTAEVLAAGLDTTTNFFSGGGPTESVPLIMQGYASAAGDGDWEAQTGIGYIDCNGYKLFGTDAQNYIHLRHLKIQGDSGGGYTYLIYLGAASSIVECEIYEHVGATVMVRLSAYGIVRRCNVHTFTGNNVAILVGFGGRVEHCYVDLLADGTPSVAVSCSGAGGVVRHNIIRCTGGTEGIVLSDSDCEVAYNSLYAASSTDAGISLGAAVAGMCSFLNNVVVGFAVGIEATQASLVEFGGNHCYNNTTNYSVSALVVNNYGDNEDLSATSPFIDPSNEDFTPVDVGNMKEGAWPASLEAADGNLTAANYRWKGAIEPTAPAGGGGTKLVGPGGGMVG